MEEFAAYPKRSKLAMMLIASVSFTVFGLMLMGAFGPFQLMTGGRFGTPLSPQASSVMGWILGPPVFLFGGAGSFSLLRMIASGAMIRIGAEGIWWKRWSDKTIPWDEIADVTTWGAGDSACIELHLRHPALYPGHGILGALAGSSRRMTGGDISVMLSGTDRRLEDAMAAIERFSGKPASALGQSGVPVQFGRRRA